MMTRRYAVFQRSAGSDQARTTGCIKLSGVGVPSDRPPRRAPRRADCNQPDTGR